MIIRNKRIVYLWSSSLTSCKYILLNTAVFLNYQNHILGQANELVLFSTKPADMIKIFCLLLEFKAYMNSSTVLDSVKVQIRHLIVTYFTTLYLTVHGPPSVMIPSLVKNVTELVDDGTNFNNCF